MGFPLVTVKKTAGEPNECDVVALMGFLRRVSPGNPLTAIDVTTKA
jgi:hypothetical protein